MNAIQRSGLALLVILAVAVVMFGYVTRGFSAITSDRVRAIDLMRSPRALPDIPLTTSSGRRIRLSTLGAPGRTTLVTLIYAHCETICRLSEREFKNSTCCVHGIEISTRSPCSAAQSSSHRGGT